MNFKVRSAIRDSVLNNTSRNRSAYSMGYNMMESDFVFTGDLTGLANSIWEIAYGFDLGGSNIIIPDGVVLMFVGGRFFNGTITGDKTRIDSELQYIFDPTNLVLAGTWEVNTVYPQWWGAIGDGVYNNTSSFQAAADFAAVFISSLMQNNQYRCTVFIPSGNYLIDSLKISKGTKLKGEDRASTIIQQASNTAALIYTEKVIGVNNRYIGISDISLRGIDDISGITYLTQGIYLFDSNYESYIERVNVTKFYDNIVIEDSWTMRVSDCFLNAARRRNLYCLTYTASIIENCRIDAAEEHNIYIQGSDNFSTTTGLNIVNNAIQRAQGSAIVFRDTSRASLTGNFFEGNNMAGGYPYIDCTNSVTDIQLLSSGNHYGSAGLSQPGTTVFLLDDCRSIVSTNDYLGGDELETGFDSSAGVMSNFTVLNTRIDCVVPYTLNATCAKLYIQRGATGSTNILDESSNQTITGSKTISGAYFTVTGPSVNHGYSLERDGKDTYQLRHLSNGLAVYNQTDNKTELQFDGTGNATFSDKLSSNTLNISLIPTSSAGLSSGDVWSNSGVLNIIS